MYDPVRLRDLETTYNGPIPGHLLSAARLPEGPLGQRLRREGALRFARWNLLITRDPRHQPRAGSLRPGRGRPRQHLLAPLEGQCPLRHIAGGRIDNRHFHGPGRLYFPGLV